MNAARASLDPRTVRQIAALSFSATRPVIICDVDEVILRFIAGLEQYLAQNGYRLARSSFALNGNIRHAETDEPANEESVRALLAGFFTARAIDLEPVEGAVEALNALSQRADVALLTNLPHRHRPARLENLRKIGLSQPVIVNRGPKGPAVRLMLDGVAAGALFLDDNAGHLNSVHEMCPDVALIQFMHDPEFAKVAPPVAAAHLKTSSWTEAAAAIDTLFWGARQPGS